MVTTAKQITGVSRVYNRDTINTLQQPDSKSEKYSRSQARQIFERRNDIHCVEYVASGLKTDSQFVGDRGCDCTPAGVWVIVCSTGGKWGKSRRVYRPAR